MIRRGDIYFVDLNPVKGREQAGTRPVAVISIDTINRLPLVVTVVIGTNGVNIDRDFKTNVRVLPVESRLAVETVFLGFQVRSLDPQRFPKRRAGKLSNEALSRLKRAIRYSFGL